MRRDPLKAFTDWFFAPAPAERLAVVRACVAGFGCFWVTSRLQEIASVATYPTLHPVGVVKLLHAPLPPALVMVIAAITSAALLAMTLGAGYRISGPLAAIGTLWTLSYRNSFGMVFHTENLLVLHLLALAFAPAADAWSIDARRARPAAGEAGHGWALKLMVMLLAGAYLLAGIAKLRISGAAWLDGEALRNQIAFDNVRKAVYGSSVAPFATLLLDHPAIMGAFTWGSMCIELGGPILVVGGRWRAVRWLWSGAAWSFHVGVVLLMNIWFPYPLSGVAFVPLFEVERPVLWLIARKNELRAKLRS
ncbi:MAG TPA: HTTM domain-containing protein [Kofleriaceae bacterium]